MWFMGARTHVHSPSPISYLHARVYTHMHGLWGQGDPLRVRQSLSFNSLEQPRDGCSPQ